GRIEQRRRRVPVAPFAVGEGVDGEVEEAVELELVPGQLTGAGARGVGHGRLDEGRSRQSRGTQRCANELAPIHQRATFATVSHVRVVWSLPNVFSISVMNTGPFGFGRYALKISPSSIVRMRAPSVSTGSLILAVGRPRRNVTMRLALGLTRNGAYGSVASTFRSCATGRTMVRNACPNRSCMAASALCWRVCSELLRASNTTLPLPSTVFTSVNPAASNAACNAGILQLVGMTPRRNAA